MSRQINLYDVALRAHREYAAATVLLLGGSVVALGMLIAWVYFTFEVRSLAGQAQQIEAIFREKQDQLRLLQDELAGRQQDKRVASRLQERQNERRAREEVLAALGSGQLDAKPMFSAVLQALGRQRVEGVWLTSIEIEAGVKSVTLEGKTLDPDLLANYLRRLNSESALRGTRFAILELTREADPASTDKGVLEARPVALSFRLGARRADDSGKEAR